MQSLLLDSLRLLIIKPLLEPPDDFLVSWRLENHFSDRQVLRLDYFLLYQLITTCVLIEQARLLLSFGRKFIVVEARQGLVILKETGETYAA